MGTGSPAPLLPAISRIRRAPDHADYVRHRKQKVYANKIKPIRKNGHLLLVTLLLANMIVNESLPVISDPILGGGVQSVVVSTVLIVMYVFRHSVSQALPFVVRTP